AYIDQFCEWLGMPPRSLQFMLNQHRNPKFWEQIEPDKWQFNGWSQQRNDNQSIEDNYNSIKSPIIFEANSLLEYKQEAKYITIGKGYP
ncbi:hypothetical protein MEN41_19775, partial [Dolichospermum sp. ST_con]|nr:hypothetical protein [Dolichospermum sp. ST_con]